MTRVQISQRVRSCIVQFNRRCMRHVLGLLVLFARDQFLVALGTEFVFAGQVAVCRADREGRRDGDVRQSEVAQRALDQALAGLAARHLFRQVQVQHGAPGVLALQVVLALQCLERIVGEPDRQLRAVGVVRRLVGARLQDVRITLAVLLGKTIGCALGRRRFEVVQVPGLLLELDHALRARGRAAGGECVTPVRGDVVAVGGEVADHLVDAIHPDGREMIAQGSEVTLGVREQARHPCAAGSPCALSPGCCAR